MAREVLEDRITQIDIPIMKSIKNIQVTSTRDLGGQVIKDSLTATEKKILIHMLNAGLNEGQVRNKVFHISNKMNNTAVITLGTITKSIILGKNEVTRRSMKIKYT